MIKVTISRKNSFIASLEIKGHSNSAPYGEDLICAAVSAVATGGANALLKINSNIVVVVKEGYLSIKDIPDDNILQTIINAIVIQLETIANENKKYLKISFITK